MTQWIEYRSVQVIQAHRTGWSGAFDAIVSAVTGRPRLAVPTKIRVSLRATGPVDIAVVQVTPEGD